jgi:N-acetylmuramoyl-L-alanine amidase
MQTQFGFTKFSVVEFENWIASVSISRNISKIQEHHTWSPNYSSFDGANHFALQRGMKNYHVNHNGWTDIGQNLSIFPDGQIVTGRPMNTTPACIYGNNSGAICIENVGDFDVGQDSMNSSQRDAIVRATAALCRRFNLIPANTNNVVYHHWFDLNTGQRTNGTGSTKSCPGTAFFGGNRVSDCEDGFLPLVKAVLDGGGPAPALVPGMSFGRVISDTLNIRSASGSENPIVDTQGPLVFGDVIRIFDEDDEWFKISNSKEYWVYSKWVRSVTRRLVNTDDAKVRTGPGTEFQIIKSLMNGDEVFVGEMVSGWAKIDEGEFWISQSLIS